MNIEMWKAIRGMMLADNIDKVIADMSLSSDEKIEKIEAIMSEFHMEYSL